MGAAVIAAKACLRSGTGLLTVNVPKAERFIVQTSIPEAMLMLREDESSDFNQFSSIGIGPGLGTVKATVEFLSKAFKAAKPLLLDADALTVLSTNEKLLAKVPAGTILTPHPKEFDRLFGIHGTDDERSATAIRKAKDLNLVIVLKNYQTLITFTGEAFLNTTGNAGLAKGGSGDALSGIITAFLAQGYHPFTAAKLGVYIHGLGADMTLKQQSMESMLITDVIENLGEAFKYLLQ